jgi:peptide methionine sulfoxide reductase msrA/msrB
MNKKYSQLEFDVMFNKATEMAFTGELTDNKKSGLYVCKNCQIPLYNSEGKFASSCGWPAFDQAIGNNVREVTDSDGRRTEILCNNCGIHLGHVFRGERLTDLNTRFCVNSSTLTFISSEDDNYQTFLDTISSRQSMVVGCGCFWGVQYHFDKLPGVIQSSVGYCGGNLDNPTYQQVCTKKTGHFESINIIYDTTKISFEKLIRFFFEIHDFTQTNGQGNDVGPQYESVIFYKNQSELETCKEIIVELTEKKYKVATKLLPNQPFWIAETNHQDYYQNNGHSPYCHFYKKIF